MHKEREKMAGKSACVHLGRKIETKACSRQLKLLLPAILINSLPQFIEKVIKNCLVQKIKNFKSEQTFETPCKLLSRISLEFKLFALQEPEHKSL